MSRFYLQWFRFQWLLTEKVHEYLLSRFYKYSCILGEFNEQILLTVDLDSSGY